MLRRSTTSCFLLLTAIAAHAGIDLTPSSGEYVAQGIKHQQLIFHQDKQRIEYEPPPGWGFEGSSHLLRLKPPQQNQFAEAIIEAVRSAAPQGFDEQATKALEQEAIGNLPPGSQFVKVELETHNPIPLNRNQSLEVTISYQVIGEKFWRSVLLVNLPDTGLIFRLTARKQDFDALHREFATSISSWQWVDENEAATQPSQAASVITAR